MVCGNREMGGNMKRVAMGIAAVLAGVSLALAYEGGEGGPGRRQGHPDGHGPMGMEAMHRMDPAHGFQMILDKAKELDLTSEQVSKINAMRITVKEQVEEVMKRMHAEQKRFMEAIHGDAGVDVPAGEAVAKVIAGLHEQMMVIPLRAKADVEKILTEAQREKMKAMRKSMPHPEGEEKRGE